MVEKQGNGATWKLNLVFEYTARDMLQQNSLAEVSFATVGNRGRAMMIAANIPYETRYNSFHEAFTCATMLDWLVVSKLDGKKATRVEHLCGELPCWSKALRIWQEAGAVKV
eukprot:15150227-Ditylum_brightwellii.AAC.2